MASHYLTKALVLALIVCVASSTAKSVSCDTSEGWCSSEVSSSFDGDSLSLAQLRAVRRISPTRMAKVCPHKCIIKDVKSGRRLYAAGGEDAEGEEDVGASHSDDIRENQMWFIDPQAEGTFVIKNVASGRRIYAHQGNQDEDGVGAKAILPVWEDMVWYIEGTEDDHFIIKNVYSDRRLYARDGLDGTYGLGATNKGAVTEDQKWSIEPVEDGTTPAPGSDESHAWAVEFQWSFAPSPAGAGPPYGPDQWSLVQGSEACGEEGTQSPIDLNIGTAVERPHEKARDLVLETYGDCERPAYLLNERNAEFEYSGEECSKALKVNWMGTDYYLVQFHYHSPSEHTVDGGYYPLEVHHVHKDDEENGLVIAVMCAVAYEPEGIDVGPSAFLLDVISKMPHPGDDKTNNRFEVQKITDKWNPYRDFIPDLKTHGFLTYLGSFETPPCTSGTRWIIAGSNVKIPSSTLTMYRELINSNHPNQLAQFGTILGKDETAIPHWHPDSHMTEWSYLLQCNNRPIQPLTGKNNYLRTLEIVTAEVAVPVDIPGTL